AAQGPGELPGPAPAPHPVHHRGGRLGRGRQVHHGPPAARADGALAGHPAGPAGDHRRLPPPQRGARGARDDAAQGLPRELRPARPAALRGGCEGRARARRGAGLLAPDLRHPRGRARGGRAAGRADRRGAERAAAGPAPPRRPPGDGGLGLLRLLRLRRCADGGRAALVREPLPAAAADGVLRPPFLLPALRGPHRRGGGRDGGGHLAFDQRPEPSRERGAHPGPRRPGAAQGRPAPRALGAAAEGVSGGAVSGGQSPTRSRTMTARRSAISVAFSSDGASTITRTTGSVPDGRSSTRPVSPSSASAAWTAWDTPRSIVALALSTSSTLIRACGRRVMTSASSR